MEARTWRCVVVLLLVGLGLSVPVLAQTPAQPPLSCESQLKDALVELQIVSQQRSMAEKNWARAITEGQTLAQENTALKAKAEAQAPVPPAAPVAQKSE